MGRIILKNNGKTTILTSGEELSSITPISNTYFVGANDSDGIYKKLNPNGTVIDLEGGSNGIIIPQLYFDAGYTTSAGSQTFEYVQEDLRFWWNSNATEFLSHNPRIFLFLKRKRTSRPSPSNDNGPYKMRHGFVHPTHKRNSNIYHNPNYSAFYNSTKQTTPFCPSGMTSEFPLSLTATTKTYVQLDPNEWFKVVSGAFIGQKLTPQIYSGISYTEVTAFGSGEDTTKWVSFAFAIGIDNPDFTLTNKKNPILFGPLTSTIKYGFKGDPIAEGGGPVNRGKFSRFGFVMNNEIITKTNQ